MLFTTSCITINRSVKRHPTQYHSTPNTLVLRHLALSCMLLFPALATAKATLPQDAQSPQFVEGRDYLVLTQPDQVKGNQIVVREFFWYGCPHCYHFEPHLSKWLLTKPKDVTFIRTPAPLNTIWERHARGYYTAKRMGLAEKTHTRLMHHIHGKNMPLTSEKTLTEFYTAHGADPTVFRHLFHSKVVNADIDSAKAAFKRYQLGGVPALVIQGKYVVKGNNVKSIAVTNYLIHKVRQTLPVPKQTNTTMHDAKK